VDNVCRYRLHPGLWQHLQIWPLAGSLESRALQFVREWAALRHDEILANWDRARRNEPLLGIDPLA
jgi:hypothetical protein